MSNLPPQSALATAIEQLRSGNGAQAEALIVNATEAVLTQYGPESPEYAAALFDLGSFFVAIESFERAVDTMREATNVPYQDESGQRDHLTYVLNLGELLIHVEQFEEAETVLRTNLIDREAFYGRQHAGYAFALIPLAEVTWLTGSQDEAQELILQAVQILWVEGNPRVAQAIALQAFILASNGFDSGFELIREVPLELIEDILQQVFHRQSVADPGVTLMVLQDALRWVDSVPAVPLELKQQVLAQISTVARTAEEQSVRLGALKALLELSRKAGDLRQEIDVEMALGLALSEINEPEKADYAYQRAGELARSLNDPGLYAGVLRNYGLFLADLERRADAEPVLRKSVAIAQSGLDQLQTGRALIALGIFLQHDHKLAEAQELLEQALGILPVAHPDTLYARSHLDAIQTNQSCGCGDMSDAIAVTLKALVEPNLPPDLLDEISLGEDMDVQVQLKREPTEEEVDQLNRVIGHAVRELRERLRRQGFSGTDRGTE